jgi:hypothetical protein
MKPRKVQTPGSYGRKETTKIKTGTGKSKTGSSTPLRKTSKKKMGRPAKKAKRGTIRHRQNYTEQA